MSFKVRTFDGNAYYAWPSGTVLNIPIVVKDGSRNVPYSELIADGLTISGEYVEFNSTNQRIYLSRVPVSFQKYVTLKLYAGDFLIDSFAVEIEEE